MYKTLVTILTTTLAIVMLGATLGTGLITESADATELEKDPGASGNAPEEEPKIPGWDPGLAEEDAPGQLKEGPHCIGCAKDFAPGQEALEQGAIGPKK